MIATSADHKPDMNLPVSLNLTLHGTAEDQRSKASRHGHFLSPEITEVLHWIREECAHPRVNMLMLQLYCMNQAWYCPFEAQLA
jgi:hypothetical protein